MDLFNVENVCRVATASYQTIMQDFGVERLMAGTTSFPIEGHPELALEVDLQSYNRSFFASSVCSTVKLYGYPVATSTNRSNQGFVTMDMLEESIRECLDAFVLNYNEIKRGGLADLPRIDSSFEGSIKRAEAIGDFRAFVARVEGSTDPIRADFALKQER